LPKDWRASWDGRTPLNTPVGKINFQLLHQKNTSNTRFILRARQGGEILRQAKRGQRDVKRLLQELQLPPWQRNQLIFIWQNESLIAVDKYLLAEGWQIVN